MRRRHPRRGSESSGPARHHDDAHLFWRLKALAYYLATQHDRTANGRTVDFDTDCAHFTQLVSRLGSKRLIGSWDVDELLWLQELWHDRTAMWQDRQVWLHGDATPANFLFGSGLDVAAIDLERTKRGDRMFDVGRVAGEIHAVMDPNGVAAIAFDVNGTLVDIHTEDDREDIFRAIGHFLTYQGIDLRRHAIRDTYFERLKQQQRESPEEFPEFDAVAIWASIVAEHATDFTRALPQERFAQLRRPWPRCIAGCRGASSSCTRTSGRCWARCANTFPSPSSVTANRRGRVANCTRSG